MFCNHAICSNWICFQRAWLALHGHNTMLNAQVKNGKFLLQKAHVSSIQNSSFAVTKYTLYLFSSTVTSIVKIVMNETIGADTRSNPYNNLSKYYIKFPCFCLLFFAICWNCNSSVVPKSLNAIMMPK